MSGAILIADSRNNRILRFGAALGPLAVRFLLVVRRESRNTVGVLGYYEKLNCYGDAFLHSFHPKPYNPKPQTASKSSPVHLEYSPI